MMKRLALLIAILVVQTNAQISPDAYSSLHWRSIGPYRAGRITAVAGVPTQPNVYFAGTPNGGVWKTTNAGQTWMPIFDKVPFASIGAVAVSESNPNTIYVGTGEQTTGHGVYKSTDAGATWTHVGLATTYTITSIAIDPKNPDVVLVASNGSGQFSDMQTGIFKSTNGGKDWNRVLFKDTDTGVLDMNMAIGNPKVMYASLFHNANNPPGAPPNPNARREQNAFIYRSTDEGSTWQQVAGKGLPTEPLGRIGVVAFPSQTNGARSKTVYAIVAQGFFRSDDLGDTWQQVNHDPRIVGNGYFGRIFVDPTDGNSIYAAQTSMYHSADGGKTFTAVFGAPSGDDYHLIWINPLKPENMICGVDQGAIVSVDRGATWSNWYNQPTGQFYHVTTDDRFPYRVYAAQQDSGTAEVASRSDFGEITDRDWQPAGGFEFSFTAPDPLNTNIVYIGGWYGSIMRFDRTTGQVLPVFVKTPKYRTAGMAPVGFSPQDHKTLYVGAQYVMKSEDGGAHWSEISPDLTKVESSNASPADRARNNNATISTMSLSSVAENTIWAGTSNAVIQFTRDGHSWQNVTPAGLADRSSVQAVEASPHDAASAFAVIRGFRDPHPYIYRTHDSGKTWQLITSGIAANYPAWVVREDPARRGLLYAGTDNAAYISFDEGDHWQSLQLDLPTAPVRDMVIKGDDLVIATYGRSLYILDDLTPLRQLVENLKGGNLSFVRTSCPSCETQAHLFTPEKATRSRWDNNQDTPYPSETPAAPNPPDGAIIDYYLASPLSSADDSTMKLQIFDAQHNLVREFTTKPDDYDHASKNVPDYWFKEPAALTNHAGINRFVWDLRYPSPQSLRYSYFGQFLDYIEYSYSDHAIPGETPHETLVGPYVLPGDYTVSLTIHGQTFTQPLTVSLDPRVHISTADLAAQLDTQRNISAQMATTFVAYNQLTALKSELDARKKQLPEPEKKSARLMDERLGVPTSLSSRAERESAESRDLALDVDSAPRRGATTRNSELETQNAIGNIPANDETETPDEMSDPDPDPDLVPPQRRNAAPSDEPTPTDPLSQLDAAITKLRDGSSRDLGIGPINRELARLGSMIGSGDGRPAAALVDAVNQSCETLATRMNEWKDFAGSPSSPLQAANIYLHDHNLAPLPALNTNAVPPPPACSK